MSSAEPTEGIELDPQTTEEPADAPDATTVATESSPSENALDSGEKPAWRRTLARIPGEAYVLAVLAAITRFAFLYNPKAIVFDEVYFREYALHYKAGTYYFDLHPPLGKLLLGAWAAISASTRQRPTRTPPSSCAACPRSPARR